MKIAVVHWPLVETAPFAKLHAKERLLTAYELAITGI